MRRTIENRNLELKVIFPGRIVLQVSARRLYDWLNADFCDCRGIGGLKKCLEICEAEPSVHELAPGRVRDRNNITGTIAADDMKMTGHCPGIAICPSHIAADKNPARFPASSRIDNDDLGIRDEFDGTTKFRPTGAALAKGEKCQQQYGSGSRASLLHRGHPIGTSIFIEARMPDRRASPTYLVRSDFALDIEMDCTYIGGVERGERNV